MTDQVRTSAQLRAEEIAAAMEAGRAPATLTESDDDDEIVQILDADDTVVAASEDVPRDRPVAVVEPGGNATIPDPDRDDYDDHDHDFVVVAEDADTDRGDLVVLVGRSTAIVHESTTFLVPLLAAGVPILTLSVGVVTWWIVGRTLAPVEAIRREVDAISATRLHRRVPDPDTRDEIARLAATMNRMLARLEAAQLEQRRFVSDASHELRSPVAAIRHHAEVAVTHPETISTADLAGVVLAEDLRLQQLVEDLLFLARSDETTDPTRLRPVDLDDLVLDEARRLRSVRPWRVDTTGVHAVRVSGDAVRLARMFRNLGDNAARHATGTVRFGLTRSQGTAVCTVEDDGTGIAAVDTERVFQRFVRLDAARSRDRGGSGLGLAIVDEIVTTHRGSIRVDTSPLGGARFTITLPAVADDPTADG